MKIVEFRCDHPILRETLRQVPGIELEWVQSDIRGEDRIFDLFWARGGDFDAFEAAIEDDPTITHPRRTVEMEARRLYQIEIVDEGIQSSIYPIIVEEGCIIQSLRGTSDGWEFRVAFPNDEAISRFFEFCSENGISYTIHLIFEEQSDNDYGLTKAQHETIHEAFRRGYFDVPRRSSLQDLATELDISDTAASQRLRRGMRTIVERTVYSTGDTLAQEPVSKVDRLRR